MKKTVKTDVFKVVLIVTVIFAVSRLVILSSILCIRGSELSPNAYGYKRVAAYASIVIPGVVDKLYITADTQQGSSTINIVANGETIGSMKLTPKTDIFIFDMNGLAGKQENKLEFISADGARGWRVWEIRTDNNIYNDILKLNNSNFVQDMQAVGFSGSVVHKPGDAREELLLGMSKWDANIYAGIAEKGYSYTGNDAEMYNVVFPYIFPLAIFAVKELLGCSAIAAGIIVNNLAVLLSAIVLYYVSAYTMNMKFLSYIPVVLLLFNPYAYFLTSSFSEGLFILLLLCSVLMLYKDKYMEYALFAGALSGIRMVGVVSVPVLLYQYFIVRKNKPGAMNLLKAFFLSVISVWGLISYMIYQKVRFGDFLAAVKNQKAWTPGSISPSYLMQQLNWFLHKMADYTEPRVLAGYIIVIITGFCIFYYLDNRRKITDRERLLLFITLSMLAVPLIFYSKIPYIHNSMGRYTLPAFPIYILLCRYINRNTLVFLLLLITLSTFLMVIMTMRAALGFIPN